MVEKKASEILYDLEQRFGNLEASFKLVEFQLKLIIDNFNKFFMTIDTKTINYIPVSKIDEPAKQIIESPPAKEETLIEKKNRLMKIQNTNSMSSEPPQEKVEYNFNVRRTGNSNMPKNKIINNNTLENEGGKKIPVTQRLILFDGDPMVNAKVLVKNDKDEVIKTVETSSAGRWQVALSPGKYSVNVSGKHGGSTIGFNQSFEVPDMNSPLDLPSPKAYKKIK